MFDCSENFLGTFIHSLDSSILNGHCINQDGVDFMCEFRAGRDRFFAFVFSKFCSALSLYKVDRDLVHLVDSDRVDHRGSGDAGQNGADEVSGSHVLFLFP